MARPSIKASGRREPPKRKPKKFKEKGLVVFYKGVPYPTKLRRLDINRLRALGELVEVLIRIGLNGGSKMVPLSDIQYIDEFEKSEEEE